MNMHHFKLLKRISSKEFARPHWQLFIHDTRLSVRQNCDQKKKEPDHLQVLIYKHTIHQHWCLSNKMSYELHKDSVYWHQHCLCAGVTLIVSIRPMSQTSMLFHLRLTLWTDSLEMPSDNTQELRPDVKLLYVRKHCPLVGKCDCCFNQNTQCKSSFSSLFTWNWFELG